MSEDKTQYQTTFIGKPVQLEEKSRTYYYVRNQLPVQVKLTDVTELIVRESGSHRLKTKDGRLHYMPADFYHIEIEVNSKEWTV